MIPEMKKFDEEEMKAEIIEEEAQNNALVEQKSQAVSLGDYSVDKIKARIDENKSFEEQVEDYAAVQATMAALKDEGTQEVLTQQKKSQLIDKANVKVKVAQKEVIEAETEIQKAERESYEGILETFGFFRHLPRWLLKAIVFCLTPFYLIIGFIIGIPCGFIKILIDNIDAIICKYEKANETTKPRIKVIVWVLLALIALGSICLTVLGCLHII